MNDLIKQTIDNETQYDNCPDHILFCNQVLENLHYSFINDILLTNLKRYTILLLQDIKYINK